MALTRSSGFRASAGGTGSAAELFRRYRETGDSDRFAGVGCGLAALERPDLQPCHAARGHIVERAVLEGVNARQFLDHRFGVRLLSERTELDSPFASDRRGSLGL